MSQKNVFAVRGGLGATCHLQKGPSAGPEYVYSIGIEYVKRTSRYFGRDAVANIKYAAQFWKFE